ncbi:hypothetical protein FGB62_58g033 [Gracilaria domingensis]|nr:hypothetical protein FGB62_58g033 [Gracilaria domingensis]
MKRQPVRERGADVWLGSADECDVGRRDAETREGGEKGRGETARADDERTEGGRGELLLCAGVVARQGARKISGCVGGRMAGKMWRLQKMGRKVRGAQRRSGYVVEPRSRDNGAGEVVLQLEPRLGARWGGVRERGVDGASGVVVGAVDEGSQCGGVVAVGETRQKVRCERLEQ